MTLALTPSAAQREKLMRLADYLVIGIAIALPWSTSATVILVCAWAIMVVPTITPEELKEEMTRPAAYLPVLLFVLGVLGMLWADVPLKDRWKGLDSFLKLLAIPILFIQFRRTERGFRVLIAFLASSALLLTASGLSLVKPTIGGWYWPKSDGLPVKDYISQSAIFTLCALGVFFLALEMVRQRRIVPGALLTVLGLLFLADMFFVVTSRTALFTIPILLVLLGSRVFGWKGILVACVAAIVAAAAIWAASPVVRLRVSSLVTEVQRQQTENVETPAGARLDFWKRSMNSWLEAPLLGHGTGSIRESFRRSATGEGASAVVSVNPHNQTFAVAIQLGFAGTALLYAMWFSHLLLFFRGAGIAAWAGILLVVQNFLGGIANSHLFDFTHGWIYCLGVGVAGGMVRSMRSHPSPLSASRFESVPAQSRNGG